jgi:aminoglycoside/choline kinase family phosphotransferase
VPDCVYAAIDEATGHGIILMEDVVAQGGRFLTALEPYTPEEAHGSLEQLAKLHAAEWGRPGEAYPWLVSRIEQMAATPMLPLDLLQTMIDGERGIPLPAAIKSAERIQKGLQSLVAGDAGQPQCLVHGDAHAGNLFVLNGQVSVIDWQVMQRAHWALDVSYHIGAALSVEDRQQHEQALLRHYLERLASFGAQAPSWDEAWLQYRRHMVYGYFMWAITRRVTPPIIHEFVRRLGLAVSQLETFELLKV